MKTDYRIEPAGATFIVIDDLGERVDTYPTKAAAQQDIERCKRGETARYWVFSAAEVVD
jgi:hypothetical protein